MQRLYEKYRSQGLAVVALNISPDEDALLPAWRDKGKYTFPIVLASAEDFAKRTYGVSEAPVSLVLNGEGQAICRYVGADSDSAQMLETDIRILLGLDPRR